MKFSKTFFAKVKHFCRDTTASFMIVGAGTMSVVIVTSGVGLDLMSVQMQENAAAAQLKSAGIFATANNTCTGLSGNALTTCDNNLTKAVNSYLNSIGSNVTASLTPGLWCSTGFVATPGTCPSGSGTAAVQLSGIMTYNTRFLKLAGVSTINRKMDLTLANDKVTAIATTGICPGIILNEYLLVSPSAGNVAWNDQGQIPRYTSRQVLRVNSGTQYSFQGSNGTYQTSNPFWMADTGGGGRTSYPSSERNNNTSTPISQISQPSGSSFDLTAGTKFRVWSNQYTANSSEFGKTVNDPDYGTVNVSDNGGPQIFRKLKKNYEGKTCMAMVGHDNGDGTVTINSVIPVTFDVICDGKRKRVNSQWVALKDDGVTTESKCTYVSDTDKVDPSIALWFGEGRTSDSASYVPSDKNKWGGDVKGDNSKGKGIGFMASSKKVVDSRSYQ